ncbi:hypothetical protein MferCBS31731_007309 [Microsporum ferrugineum]
MAALVEYTRAELASHNSPRNLWISISGYVYDITDYQEDHPGGEELLRNVAGQDATAFFEDAGHSQDAYAKLESLRIGKLAGSEEFTPRQKALVVTVDKSSIGFSKAGRKQGDLTSLVSALLFRAPMALYAFIGSALFIGAARYLFGALLPTLPASSLLSGFLTAAAFQITAVMVLWGHMKQALQRHRKLEDFPRVIQPRIPLHPRRQNSVPKPGILSHPRTQFLTLVDRQCITHHADSASSKPNSGSAGGVYRLRLKYTDDKARMELGLGQHLRISAEIDGAVIQRSYTPVSELNEPGPVDLLVKIYPEGRMSKHLLHLPLHTPLAIRGPFGSYHPKPTWKAIGCIAGGTGITPIYQVLREWCRESDSADKDEPRRATLLYGCESKSDILLSDELDGLVHRYPDNIQVHYVLSQPPEEWEGPTGWITREMMEKFLPKPGPNTGFLICGPNVMVRAIQGYLEVIQAAFQEKSEVFVF